MNTFFSQSLWRMQRLPLVLIVATILAACGGGSGGGEPSVLANSLVLSVEKAGIGTVTSNPAGIACGAACSASFTTATVVTLSATPGASQTFSGWSGDCTGSASSCVVTMDQARSVRATFAPAAGQSNYTLTVSVSGTGTVASQPAGINCTTANCAAAFAADTVVALTATPAAGQSFTGWSGACTGAASSCQVTMNQLRSVSANFERISGVQSFALTVAVSGSGVVVSQPAGINCGSDCAEQYAANTSVTLTAQPASGQVFNGWGGACSGTQPTCALQLSQVRSVQAAFAVAPIVAASYEALPIEASRPALLAQLNAQGAKGFNYFGPDTLGGAAFNLYTKDSSTLFSFEILDTAGNAATFLTQLNAQGAKGFDFWGPETTGTIYSKESGGPNYNYEVVAEATTAAGFLNQANAQGDRGFLYIGPYAFGSIYRQAVGSNARYTYRLELQAASHDAQITQANAQGQEGYKFGGLEIFSGEPVGSFRNIYVKDTSQSSTFDWKANPVATSAASLISQANAERANNFVYWFGVIIAGNARDYYFKPNACSGPLCRGTSPL
jgi:Divergent InlB B-repeat domain